MEKGLRKEGLDWVTNVITDWPRGIQQTKDLQTLKISLWRSDQSWTLPTDPSTQNGKKVKENSFKGTLEESQGGGLWLSPGSMYTLIILLRTLPRCTHCAHCLPLW